MSVITARGVDSSEAMDEVIRRLGANAYILSTTTTRDGMVEIRAATELPKSPSLAADMATPTFADLLEARSDWAPAPPLRPVVPPKPTPWAPIPPEVRFQALLDRLEADLLVTEPLPIGDLMPRTVIVGPPGSGKSLLAVRLAAAALLARPGLTPRIIAPRLASLLSDDRLRGWARLIGITPERPLFSDLLQADESAGPDPQSPHIIDFSDLAEVGPEIVAALRATMPTEVILALPAGLSSRRVAQEARRWADVLPTVTLTGCDLCGPDTAALRALAQGHLRLTRFAQGIGVIDTLSVGKRADLARWLQQEADERDEEASEARA